jgi:DNA-binding FadR family transcriptional regulator
MARRSAAAIHPEMLNILSGLLPGERLPLERELAARFDCSPQTLRACLAGLEKDGEVWRHVGQGTFRGARPRHMPVRETLLIEGATPPDVMQARMLLEPMVAAEAARQASARDVALLLDKVDAGRKARDRAACEQADDAFHRALAQISGNPILSGFLNYLSGVRRRVAWQREWERTYRRIGTRAFQTLHSDQHGRIVDAIERQDPVAARASMTAHLETIRADMSVDS